MSYREMRTFTEMMCTLGFTRNISMENFRTPNFPLVAEILSWLVARYDSHADLPQCLDTEQDRVIFIKTAAHFMATRACIRLNTKKLYQANGFAVKELMKIAKVLYSAMCKNDKTDDNEASELCVTELFDISKKKQLQEGRSLSSQLASIGASLHTLLGREVGLREARDGSIRRQLDSAWVEQCVADARDALHGQVEKTEAALVNVAADEATLDGKIEKKRSELDRNRKRLATLQSVRPAYMEEYEQLEEELSSLYSFYLTRFRNLAFLENQYEELMRVGASQGEDGETTLKTIAEQLKLNSKCSPDDLVSKLGTHGGMNESTEPQSKRQNGRGVADTAGDDRLDEDDDDEVEDGLIDGQEEEDDDAEDDDDDDDDSEDDDAVDSSGPLERKHDERIGRNQLVPGWSPSRQRIPGASYHGRPSRNYPDNVRVVDKSDLQNSALGRNNVQKDRKIVTGAPARSTHLIESANENRLSNEEEEEDDEDEDEGDEDVTDGLIDEFTRNNTLSNELGTTKIQPGKELSRTTSKNPGLGLAKGVEDEEDDDF
ncbi:Clusterin-associated protein 1 [Paragonimus heterotremus]|uniref:Clusterin-associated protein 1 n=1 Tax=Paragonimus heterotremus TaxID=100268 RepID=A0A8J4SNA7_9TREM|nr:Clusterin-associated protein 1 [Paragonimus heterotremus]